MEDKISKIAKIADTIVGVADENYSYLSDKAIRKMKSVRYIQHETGKYKKK